MGVHPALHKIISLYPLSEKYKEMLRTIHPSGLQIFDGDRAVRLFREIVQLSFWEELSTRYDEIMPNLFVDETSPIGEGSGPNPTRRARNEYFYSILLLI